MPLPIGLAAIESIVPGAVESRNDCEDNAAGLLKIVFGSFFIATKELPIAAARGVGTVFSRSYSCALPEFSLCDVSGEAVCEKALLEISRTMAKEIVESFVMNE